jgi:hypothetical protein
MCDRPPGLFEWAFGPRNPMKNCATSPLWRTHPRKHRMQPQASPVVSFLFLPAVRAQKHSCVQRSHSCERFLLLETVRNGTHAAVVHPSGFSTLSPRPLRTAVPLAEVSPLYERRRQSARRAAPPSTYGLAFNLLLRESQAELHRRPKPCSFDPYEPISHIL